MRFILIIILWGSDIILLAQPVITGRVTDSKTNEPLAYANVFIANTTIGIAADENGYFKLSNVPIGQSELAFSFVGYLSYQTKVKLNKDQQLVVNARLVASNKVLENVEVQGVRDKQWDSQLKKFTTAFLGIGPNASGCKIANPWVLEFKEDKGVLSATSSSMLNIENKSLGYTISYSLKKFEIKGGDIMIFGIARFQEIKTTEETVRAKWTLNRWNSYSGSIQHLITALLKNKIRGEGFSLYADKSGFENSPRTAVFAKELGRSIENFDTARIQILPDLMTNGFEILLKKKIEVHYPPGFTRRNIYEDVISPVSWVELKKGSIKINSNGAVLNPESISVTGYMSSLRISDMLPTNYKPDIKFIEPKKVVAYNQKAKQDDKASKYKKSFEKMYVHTDKPYYYPGERIWFKVYVNYSSPSQRDSLSRTLYAELINSKKEIVLKKMMRVEYGFSSGDFILPDSLVNGNYYLRTYTELQRNFGNENLLMKQLPVFKLTQKPTSDNENALPVSDLTVISDKEVYKTRDKITLNLQLKDLEGNPLEGNFSLAVTDVSQVMNIKGSATILDQFPILEEEFGKPRELNYPAENGFTLFGQFLSKSGKDLRTQLDIVQLNPYQLSVVESDEQGYFQINDLEFYGENSLSISPAGGRRKPEGRVMLFNHISPPISIKNSDYSISYTDDKTPQRIYSEYDKPEDARMLEEVTIKETRTSEVNDVKHPYGAADYTFGEDIIKTQFPNLLYTLQSLNIAGLNVNPNTQTVYFVRSGKPVLYVPPGTSREEIEKSYTPMVTLDGMPLMGSAGEALMIIDPSSVASIEVTKRQSTVRGSLAPYGVISVHTKKGYRPIKQDPINKNFIKVQGYNLVNKFNSPDYGNSSTEKGMADYRSTLYWNQSVITSSESGMARIFFYASDMQGTYRVVAEGVDSSGKPHRSVTFLTIKNTQ